MANIQHSLIADSDRHPPKGASTAAEGQVPTSDGLGGVTWEAPSGTTYGGMTITDNSTAQSLTAASDSTLHTDSDYVKIPAARWAASAEEGITFNVSGGYLTVPATGQYEISAWLSLSSNTVTSTFGIKFSKDDTNTTLGPRPIVNLCSTANTVHNLAASGFANFTVGDTISMWIACDKSVDVTINDAQLTLFLLKET